MTIYNRPDVSWDYDTPLVEIICNLELSYRQGYREARWNRDLRPRREYGVRREEYADTNVSFGLFVGFVLT